MTTTFLMTFSEPVPGGPCPVCASPSAPLVWQSGTLAPDGQRTITHLISEGLIQQCQISMGHGWLFTHHDGTWGYQALGEGQPIP